MKEIQHVIISWKQRHERIRDIADELDAYLEGAQIVTETGKRFAFAKHAKLRELHKLRGYCEQLRVDAESLKNGADGFGKGIEEVTDE